jgi:hypothetical protein
MFPEPMKKAFKTSPFKCLKYTESMEGKKCNLLYLEMAPHQYIEASFDQCAILIT